ncbi:hypothetical protein MPH_04934 [Macrophomina phaseolina MS6]|uniref:Kinesin-like protein KIF22 n=1 Tax=Macrophomina phaseolina (strain MS6) TaxID=1126212 RepID=K2RYL2_MACPH|nr:hypothetical protein MPH_04934 [Macrophomina phaseolina MS6]
MSVRVLARIRPLLKNELEKDTIVTAESATGDENSPPNLIRIPNPKNEAESFSFQFNGVYDRTTTQQELFDKEVSPTVKHLFSGYDVTIFAYGVTGTGKTHTMRGGKSLADRGVIPRLLSAIYRRCRKLEKDGETQVEVSMSYYEIYNDRVYDLFEPPEKRTAAGLPIRDNKGKTVVVGLTERPCTTLKEFERLYDEANVNRSTSATKLNAHSSRSHAILCVQVTQTTATHTRVSKASCIDLAGSEDNRRTDNNRERLVESSAINKSLFVLAQCVEAISKKQSRIPYRESKMTRILSLGQNNGLTLMVLNLAPVRSYHLDTLSSLNFANRTKKIEVAEVENEPILRAVGPAKSTSSIAGTNLQQRQPLRALAAATNVNLAQTNLQQQKKIDKPVKAFSVYSDKSRTAKPVQTTRADPLKRGPAAANTGSRITKPTKPAHSSGYGRPTALQSGLSKEAIEALIERRLEEKLAERALNESSTIQTQDITEAVKQRLEALEERVGKTEDGRAEGLHFLLMAKQHHVRGEDVSALKMYQLALPHFPENEKLSQKIVNLQEKIRQKKEAAKNVAVPQPTRSFVVPESAPIRSSALAKQPLRRPAVEPIPISEERPLTALTRPVSRKLLSKKSSSAKRPALDEDHDASDAEPDTHDSSFVPEDDDAGASDYRDDDEGDSFVYKPKSKSDRKQKMKIFRDNSSLDDLSSSSTTTTLTPRTQRLLDIINTREVSQIRLLKGVGAKKAEAIVNSLCEMDGAAGADEWFITDLEQLGGLRGVGAKTVENMRAGLAF